MSFLTWLLSQRPRNDPVGDLARDVSTYRRLPRVETYHALRAHLEKMHACDGALRALRLARSEYEKSLKIIGVAL